MTFFFSTWARGDLKAAAGGVHTRLEKSSPFQIVSTTVWSIKGTIGRVLDLDFLEARGSSLSALRFRVADLGAIAYDTVNLRGLTARVSGLLTGWFETCIF